MIKKLTLLVLGIILGGCVGNRLEFYQDTKPDVDLKTFFNGNLKAWGVVQDWRGRVVRRFDVDMVGSWQGNVGTLKEDFRYYDGETQQRIWTITQKAYGTYEGRADDIIGKAAGKVTGSAVNWSYVMDVPVDDTTYRLTLDDWMWQMNDGVLINRSYLKKFGITVAELTLVMQKEQK